MTQRVERVLGAARVVLARAAPEHAEESTDTRGRAPCRRTSEPGARTSRGRLSENLFDAFRQPFETACLDRLGEAGPDDEHVVLVLRQLRQARARASRSCRFIRLRTTAVPTAFGTASPSRAPASAPASRGNQ